MNTFTPRIYQVDFLDYLKSGGKRAFVVWHRRAGKNMCAFEWLYSEALINVGLYYYVFPSLKQGKKILWEGKTGNEMENQKFVDLIDPQFLWPNPASAVNNTDMTIKFRHPLDRTKEGSMIQIVGTKSDHGRSEADHLRGTNPRGIIMDEYSEHNPVAWEILSPILVENGGWALFTMTPKGPNHAFEMYNRVKDNPKWFTQVLDCTQTFRADGSPVVSKEAIEEERAEGKTEAYIQQEYYCSWAGIKEGSYYSTQIDLMQRENRFTTDLYKPELDCFTTWDIGHEDATVVLIGQQYGTRTNWIDGFKVWKQDLRYAWNRLQDMRDGKGYRYAAHYMPWDISVHEWASSQSRLSTAYKMGMKNIRKGKKLSPEDGIDAVRRQFGTWAISSENLGWLVTDLGLYSAEDPPKTKHKHTADAIRTYATASQIPSHDLVASLPRTCDHMTSVFEKDLYGSRNSRDNQVRMYRGFAPRS